MRKVNNKKGIRRIADKTRKAGKKKNLIAVLAIAMTTVLFTSVFTVGGSLLEKQQQATKEKTKNLKEELKVAKRIFGEDSNEVANLTKKINDSKISELNLEKQLRETTAEIKKKKKTDSAYCRTVRKVKRGVG